MGRIARVVVPACAHHVTQRGVRAMSIFRDDQDRQLYLRLLAEQAEANRVRFLAWWLMTNHVHLVVVPARRESLAGEIGEAHPRYTWQVNRRGQGDRADRRRSFHGWRGAQGVGSSRAAVVARARTMPALEKAENNWYCVPRVPKS